MNQTRLFCALFQKYLTYSEVNNFRSSMIFGGPSWS